MEHNELLIVMTVCELLKESKTIPEIDRAYHAAVKRLEQHDRNQAKPRPQAGDPPFR